MKSVVLIGPIPPYKGGISHFNQCISNELLKITNVKVISWKYRFPDFLYPGKSQIEKGKKQILRNNSDIFSLSILNPFSWLSAFVSIKKNQSRYSCLQLGDSFSFSGNFYHFILC